MKRIVVIILFNTIITSLHADNDINLPLRGKTFLAPRSQSVNAARELVAWHQYINLPCQEWYGAFSLTPEYSHSFRPERIAQYYFGTDTLRITGSQVLNRDNNTQILADYFGLSPLYQSSVFLKPEIATALVDIDLYIGYHDYYFRAHVPAVWTKWTFELFEQTGPEVVPQAPYPAGYMAPAAVVPPAKTFTQAIAGGLTWGEVTEGISYGRINGSHRRSGFAEAQVALGWNFISNYWGHAGLNIRGSIPSGTRSKAVYLFEPVIGNGHHPEVGIGFTGHALLWERDGNQSIEIFSDINITHLFNSRQRRSFDLINPIDPDNLYFKGFGTRYILAKIFNSTGNFTNTLVPAIDRLTLECDVSMAVQVDAVIMASYINGNYTADLGYEAWFRSREMISNRQPLADNTYALKGTQDVVFPNLNTTQSTATIYGNEYSMRALYADPNSPVFFNDSQIDDNSAQATRGFTHKIFGNVNYSWRHCVRYVEPFLGFGGEVEFEGLNPRHEIQANKNSISQWGFWVKGGFGF